MLSSAIAIAMTLLFCCPIEVLAGGGSSEKQLQTCTGREFWANPSFYCPVDQMCYPAADRCLGPTSNVCVDPSTLQEPKCDYDSASGEYSYFLGHTGVKRRRRDIGFLSESGIDCIANLAFLDYIIGSREIEHNFVTYRGFTFEFYIKYGMQVLDLNDPQYKYIDQSNVRLELRGQSRCTWKQVSYYALYVHDNYYELCTNNCQHFAEGLMEILSDNCRSLQNILRRRSTTAMVDYFNGLSRGNCTNETTAALLGNFSFPTPTPTPAAAQGHSFSPLPSLVLVLMCIVTAMKTIISL